MQTGNTHGVEVTRRWGAVRDFDIQITISAFFCDKSVGESDECCDWLTGIVTIESTTKKGKK